MCLSNDLVSRLLEKFQLEQIDGFEVLVDSKSIIVVDIMCFDVSYMISHDSIRLCAYVFIY